MCAATQPILLPEIEIERPSAPSLTDRCRQFQSLSGAGENAPEPHKRPHWLLSLDGGGVRGLMHLHTLAELERRTGRSVIDLFDGIAGTSVGGIIACLLTLPDPGSPSRPKYSAQALLDIMMARMDRLFVPKKHSFGGTLRTHYKTKAIKAQLNELLGENRFKDRLLPTVLVACRLDSYTEQLFSTTDIQDYFTKDVAMATGAAPTYFKPQRVCAIGATEDPTSFDYFTDGGVCMNNPTLAGIALLHEHYQVLPRDIHILSLGTGAASEMHANSHLLRGGSLAWVREIARLCMTGQLSAADDTARFYCGDRYHRFDPYLGAGNVRLAEKAPPKLARKIDICYAVFSEIYWIWLRYAIKKQSDF